MSIILNLLPSGTLIEEMQTKIVTDLALTIDASGANTITKVDMDVIFEKSVDRINRELVLTLQISNGDFVIRPEEAVIDLIVLQGECLLSKRQNELSKNNPAIKRVRLEDIELEFTDVGNLRSKDIDLKFGFCAELENALSRKRADIISDIAGNDGEIIWDGTTRRFEDTDHGGTTHSHRHFNPLTDGLNEDTGTVSDPSTDDRIL